MRDCSYDVGSAPSALEAALNDFFPADLAQWLLKEMAQNRDRSLESKKVNSCSEHLLQGRCPHALVDTSLVVSFGA